MASKGHVRKYACVGVALFFDFISDLTNFLSSLSSTWKYASNVVAPPATPTPLPQRPQSCANVVCACVSLSVHYAN